MFGIRTRRGSDSVNRVGAATWGWGRLAPHPGSEPSSTGYRHPLSPSRYPTGTLRRPFTPPSNTPMPPSDPLKTGSPNPKLASPKPQSPLSSPRPHPKIARVPPAPTPPAALACASPPLPFTTRGKSYPLSPQPVPRFVRASALPLVLFLDRRPLAATAQPRDPVPEARQCCDASTKTRPRRCVTN